MTFDLHQILASKRAFRRELASREIVEKLAILDAMRERALSLRGAMQEAQGSSGSADSNASSILMEDGTPYRVGPR